MYFDFKSRKFEDNHFQQDKVALTDKNSSLTWCKLKQLVDNILDELTALKVSKGHPIFVKGDDSCMQVAFFLACVMGEFIYVPIHISTPNERLNQLKNLLNSKILVLCEKTEHSFCIEITFNNFKFHVLKKPGDFTFHSLDKEIVYVVFTSGSTGSPKAVPIIMQNILSYLEHIDSNEIRILSTDIVINTFSFSFDGSLFPLLPCLQKGATCILDSANGQHDFISSQKPNIWTGTPSSLKIALISPWLKASANYLKRFWLGGESLTSFIVEKLWSQIEHAEVWNNYGPTEATIAVSNCKITKKFVQKYTTLPIALGDFTKKISLINTFTENTHLVGEIQIHGDSVSSGYLNHNLSTAFDTLSTGERIFKTGDLAYVQDGYLFFKGRLDSQIKLNGHRIDLNEIELNVLKSGFVDACSCLALKNSNEVKKIVCFYEPKHFNKPESENTQSIASYLKELLPNYMLPHDYMSLPKIPQNKNSKIDSSELLKIYEAQRL